MQYIPQGEFAALISALHRCAQGKLPVTVVGAVLSQLLALAGNAKSYDERLFHFQQIGPLNPQEAEQAIVRPGHEIGVTHVSEAASEIVS